MSLATPGPRAARGALVEFLALDVETANEDLASICQIGVADFRDGSLVYEWVTYVDPEDYFSNTWLHGIDEETVKGAPKFPQVRDDLAEWLEGKVVVCHTHFDRTAMRQAIDRYELEPLRCTWLDSARVARRTWSECTRSGYGLQPLCERIGYEFTPHDALEDAKAAGYVLLAAIDASGISLDDWLIRTEQRCTPSRCRPQVLIDRDGDPEGDLYGEVMVFTGALQVHRHEAADLAASIGCEVCSGVTERTTLLVVGDQDLKKLAGHEKSRKHRKAEALIAEGHSIRILRETDFIALVESASASGS